jgi:hypothetical protein
MYQNYQEQIAACDQEIERLLLNFQPWVDPAERPLPPDRKRKQRGRKKKNVNPKPDLIFEQSPTSCSVWT